MRDTEGLVIPKGVGPHAGRELSLMLAGRKPLAMFSDSAAASNWLPDDDFAPYVEHGLFIRREKIYRNPRGAGQNRYLYFARAGEEWRLERMLSIHKELFQERRVPTERDHIQIGLLLGYTEEEIATFLCHARALGLRLRGVKKTDVGRPGFVSGPRHADPRTGAFPAGFLKRDPAADAPDLSVS